MNVYDFDQTIFSPDSSFLFNVTNLIKSRKALMTMLPGFLSISIRRLAGAASPKSWKEHAFSYLRCFEDADAEAEKFWQKHFGRIEKWYLAQKRPDDVIISASPEFLLRPVCERLGVRLIATRMDSRSGQITGENCSGSEKVRRLYEEYPDAVIDKFYSDSLIDTPLAEAAKEAFLVRFGRIRPWPHKKD